MVTCAYLIVSVFVAGSKKGWTLRLNHESLGTARGIVMAVVGVLLLIAFVIGRLHLRSW